MTLSRIRIILIVALSLTIKIEFVARTNNRASFLSKSPKYENILKFKNEKGKYQHISKHHADPKKEEFKLGDGDIIENDNTRLDIKIETFESFKIS